MPDEQPVRPPPRIIQVPPPKAPSLGAYAVFAGVLTLMMLPLTALGMLGIAHLHRRRRS